MTMRTAPRAGWTIKRLKYVARLQYGESLPVDARQDGVVEVYGSNGPVGTHAHANTKGETIIVGRKGSFGKVAFSKSPCFCIDTTYFIDGTSTRSDLRWLYYALQTLGLDAVSQDTGVPGLSREVAHQAPVFEPPALEQRAIADFLDNKTAAIDALIARKERLLAHLEEQRDATIEQAVLRGVAGRASYKDSGVAWLGKIPVHWRVCKLKHQMARIVDCPHSTPEYIIDGDFPAVRTADVDRGSLNLEQALRVSHNEYCARIERMEPAAGDILYSREGERFGMAALVPPDVKLCMAQRMMLFRPRRDASARYYMWTLNSHAVYQQVKQDTVGATSPRINIPTISNAWVPVPPLEEQVAIAEFIDRVGAHVDRCRATVRRQLERLVEYRQALITAAVTGQLDVAARQEEAA